MKLLHFAVFVYILVLIGCSSGSRQSQPIAPDIPIFDSPTTTPELTGNSEIIAETGTSHSLLFYCLIHVDPDHPDGPQVEIIPLREGEIHLNILKLLEDGPCFDCFKIVGFKWDPGPGILDVDIQIDHPFDDLFFSIFDVRGIMMFQGSHEFPVAGKTISDPNLGDGALLNADGYTALYNGNTLSAPVGDLQKYYPGNFSTPAIPSSDINGYKYYTTDNPANDRNAFYADSSDVQTFSIKLPTGPFVLGYAVDANWWTPIESPVDDPLTDFDVDANCPEPWKIVVTEEPIGDGLTDQGGETKLFIDVYDWQGKDTHHDPVVECTELFNGQLTATWDSTGPGYARYEVTVPNDKLADVGEFWYLVGIEANENNPSGTPWLDLTAYQLQTLTVIEKTTENPVAVAEADPNPQAITLPVSFSGSDSYDPDGGDIQLYEWDWDYDSMAGFVPDQEGENVDHTWSTAGTYLVQLRVTDDESETDLLDDPLEITISDHQPPDACGEADNISTVVCEAVHFTDCGSEAYDGAEIVLHEWDWDNDGNYDEEGADLSHSWDIPGTYYVQYRVTDDQGATGILPEPIEITIINALPTAIGDPSTPAAEPDDEIIFDASASHDNDCGNQSILLYQWDWDNDGEYEEEGVEVTHSWGEVGQYLVQLRVTDNEGGTDELDGPIEIQISINDFDPVAIASADPNPQTVCLAISFDASGSSDPDGGDITLYEWDWDNDEIFDDTGIVADNSWDAPGTYYVQLQVTDDESATDTLDSPLQITVENALPTASAVADKIKVDVDEIINLDGSSSIDNDCAGNAIVTWEWDLTYDPVDGFIPTHFDPIINISYPNQGVYQVMLRVTDDEDGSDMLDEPLELTVDPCDPDTDPPVTVIECPAYNQPEGITMVPIIVNDSYDPYNCTLPTAIEYSWQIKPDGGTWGSWSVWGPPQPVGPDLIVYVGGLDAGIWDIRIKCRDSAQLEGNTEQCSVNIPVPPCSESEPNNLSANADPITLDCESVGSVCDGDNVDFWKFTLTSTTTMNFYLTFNEITPGDFSMILSGPEGPLLDYCHFNASSPIDETWPDLDAGTYHVSLMKTSGSCFDYTFILSQ